MRAVFSFFAVVGLVAFVGTSSAEESPITQYEMFKLKGEVLSDIKFLFVGTTIDTRIVVSEDAAVACQVTASADDSSKFSADCYARFQVRNPKNDWNACSCGNLKYEIIRSNGNLAIRDMRSKDAKWHCTSNAYACR